ncbi:hypothetical protein ARAM_000785 [Aspergillus rambellii]|uniref:Cholesterol oxidase n=1 Tax=Aspergillus rambellii TaxID=308745 RepID=A0A0F8WSV2_9EURO|nr:hypothetical protein ARAM_000785 [Aspergillus rambellii]
MTKHHEESRVDDYPQLSLPFRCMQPEYDVVVVGSGYGAGVAASRMARAGKRVAVLELGWEIRPGSFPQTLKECLRELNVTGSSRRNRGLRRWPLSGSPTNLFQLTLGEGQHAFTAHGLGGGSLINGGVFLEATENVLQMSSWPEEIRRDPTTLAEYYTRAAKILQPSTYPDNRPQPKKLLHLQEQSKWLGEAENFYRVPLTTFFHGTRNSTGVKMNANTGSGHECTGLNDGSKNSVAVTYLADAWNWGAEIFCGCEVRYVEEAPDGKGYFIYFSWHGKGRDVFQEEFHSQLFWVKANEYCFLGAGALGTTEILLRSARKGLSLSSLVGRSMSGNGNSLVFGYNGNDDIHGIAGDNTRSSNIPGPTITGIIDNREKGLDKDPLDGYVIEDGCIPEPFAPVVQTMLSFQVLRNEGISLIWHPQRQIRKTLAALKSLVMGPYAAGGAIQRTSTYLIMSHDSNEITASIKRDQINIEGPTEGYREKLKKILSSTKHVLIDMIDRCQEEVTVHILGGANMSRDGTGREGVTNHLGQVYTGNGSETYRGLFCCDASTIPTSLGINPLATITALAERSLSLIAERDHLLPDLNTGNGNLHFASSPRVSLKSLERPLATGRHDSYISVGWQFTEVLEGYFTDKTKEVGLTMSEIKAQGVSSEMRMVLTVEVYRGQGPRYRGICTGTVSCLTLSKATMNVMEGTIDFFLSTEDCAESTTLIYTLPVRSVEGTEYTLKGSKRIDSRTSFSFRRMWKATSTVTVVASQRDGTYAGMGALQIPILAFQLQMRTFRPTAVLDLASILSLLMFLTFFTLQISMFFFHPFIPSLLFRSPRVNPIYPSRRFASAVRELKAADGVGSLLQMYEAQPGLEQEEESISRPPVLFLPGITGVGPQFSIFDLPFQQCNMVDYFSARGYRCYVLTPRWSSDEHVAMECTVFDSRLDIAAAVEYISTQETQKPYVIAHCQGSVALGMALLSGTVAPAQLLGMTGNSVFMNQVFGYWNSVKAYSPRLIRLYEFLDGPYFPIAFHGKKGLFQLCLDFILRLYPVSYPRDLCTSAACRRTSFAFGLLWNHENLDRSTHDNIDKFFTGCPTKILDHIVRMGSRGRCLDNELRPLLTPDNIQRLKGLPILLMSGTDNEVFDPDSTLRDYELLRRQFGESLYRRFLVRGYGHLDPVVGKSAADDVYWRVFDHLKWCEEHLKSTENAIGME